MKSLTRVLAFAVALFPTMAVAHPGHDGHDLTWDFHAHGWEQAIWLALLALTGLALYRFVRNRG